MKIVLESSIYAIFLAIICFISCDLIMMNMKVSKVNEDVQYVENYIEAYGTAETENDKKYMYGIKQMKTEIQYMKL